MSTITALRRAYKDSNFTTDCQCLRIELENGTILRYTDNRSDLIISTSNNNGTEVPITPVTYSSLMGFDLSAVGGTAEQTSQVDLEGVLTALGYTREQIVAGTFDRARLYVFLTDYTRPVEDEERLFTGFWGESTIIDGRYVTKFQSLLSVFELDSTRVISQLCDAKLGDNRCGVVLDAPERQNLEVPNATDPDPTDAKTQAVRKVTGGDPTIWLKATTTGTTAAVQPSFNYVLGQTAQDGGVTWEFINARSFETTLQAANANSFNIIINDPFQTIVAFDNIYANAEVEFLDGANAGQKYVIIDHSETVLTLNVQILSAVQAGDRIKITQACDKTINYCKNQFTNTTNFQGFPHLPTRANIFRIGEK